MHSISLLQMKNQRKKKAKSGNDLLGNNTYIEMGMGLCVIVECIFHNFVHFNFGSMQLIKPNKNIVTKK